MQSITRRAKRHRVALPRKVIARYETKIAEFSTKTERELEKIAETKLSRTDLAAMLYVVKNNKYVKTEKSEEASNDRDNLGGSANPERGEAGIDQI